jgi:Flp pilus assembly protein TadD
VATVSEVFALAWKHHQAGGFREAEQLYRQVLQVKPLHVDSWCFLGAVCEAQGKLAEAETSYRQAVKLAPPFATAHNCLGVLLAKQGRRAEAVTSFREALRYEPRDPETHYNLGLALNELGQFDAAIGEFLEALRFRPDYPEALNDLGLALRGQQRLPEAVSSIERALQLRPDYAEAHWNRSLLWLLSGDYERGWPAYEWRWTQPDFVRRHESHALWDGSDLSGRTILLHAEQGLGDTLEFIRYAALVKQRGGRVILECPPALRPLLSCVSGIDELVAQGSPLPAFDVQAPLVSLPAIFRTSLDTIPATVPYLQADSVLVQLWRQELNASRQVGTSKPQFLVGIAWQGSPSYRADYLRSIPLAQFAPLADVEGVQIISLQKGPATEQLLTQGKFFVLNLGSRLDEAHGAFMDTAAIMRNVDLVISSDSAVAHLAGALGVPVWVALPLVADWRWLLQRDDSPWYPSMRLFRQTRHGHWDDVFQRLAEELKSLSPRSN